jgi:hypothetical protein
MRVCTRQAANTTVAHSACMMVTARTKNHRATHRIPYFVRGCAHCCLIKKPNNKRNNQSHRVRGKSPAGSRRQQLNLQHHHGGEGALLLAAHGQQPQGLALGALCMGARHLHAVSSHLGLPLQADDRASQGRDLAL